MDAPTMPTPVARVFAAWPESVAERHRQVRALIFATAATEPSIGPLTETLKWGEPAYLTEATRSGSTIRLGMLRDFPDRAAVLFNCQTVLLDTFRTQFPDTFQTHKDRALLLPTGQFPEEPLASCLYLALTYHRWRRSA